MLIFKEYLKEFKINISFTKWLKEMAFNKDWRKNSQLCRKINELENNQFFIEWHHCTILTFSLYSTFSYGVFCFPLHQYIVLTLCISSYFALNANFLRDTTEIPFFKVYTSVFSIFSENRWVRSPHLSSELTKWHSTSLSETK